MIFDAYCQLQLSQFVLSQLHAVAAGVELPPPPPPQADVRANKLTSTSIFTALIKLLPFIAYLLTSKNIYH